MAFKLYKKAGTVLAELTDAVQAKQSDLEQAISEYNDQREALFVAVEAAKDAYNEALETLKSAVAETAENWRNEWDERSEKWQESDRGSEVSSWIDEWEGFADTLNEAEIDAPDELEVPDFADLEAMPAEEVAA